MNSSSVQSEDQLRQEIEDLKTRLKECGDQLSAADRELQSFAYSVSHDLRAPLRAIEGFAGILTEDYSTQLDPEAARYLSVISASATKMNRLIDDLLAFSRLIRAQMEVKKLDMTELAKSVVADCQRKEPERRVDVQIADLPEARGDAPLIRKALHHLISNAFKFTRPKKEPNVEIGSFQADGETVYFIRDNGVGFDMQYAHKLFGVFQRLHRVEEFEGSGIGLAIAQRIIHRHGGRIWTEAEADQGATFYFTLHPNPPSRGEPVLP